MSDVKQFDTNTVKYHNPMDLKDIPYGFQVGSVLTVEYVESYVKEYLIFNSFYYRLERGEESMSCTQLGWIGVYPGYF